MKYFLSLFISMMFLGCVSATPPKVEYIVNAQVKAIDASSTGCKDKSLKIAQAFSPSSLRSEDMSYRVGGLKQYMYSQSLWSVNPNQAITSEFLSLIRDSKLFKTVQNSKSRSRSDVILELSVEDFMQSFNDDSTLSHVDAVINLSLINVRTNTIFASKTFSKKIKVDTMNSVGGVNALNIALDEILLDSNLWLNEVCQ